MTWTREPPQADGEARKAAYFHAYYLRNKRRIRERESARRQVRQLARVAKCADCQTDISEMRKDARRCRKCKRVAEQEVAKDKRRAAAVTYQRVCSVCRSGFETSQPAQKSCSGCVGRARVIRANKRMKERRKENVCDWLESVCRSRINNLLASKGLKKNGKSVQLLGCDLETLKSHIEKQFRDGMTWDNRGIKGWHIDHIKPCKEFNLADPDQLCECFHYTNLRPLWWYENIARNKNRGCDG